MANQYRNPHTTCRLAKSSAPFSLEGYMRRRDSLRYIYDSKDLVTHAVCVGMTAGGQTGLLIGLLKKPPSITFQRLSST